MDKKLERIEGQWLGVCEGIANYVDVDPTMIRLLFVFMTLFTGGGLFLYLIMAIVMPKKIVTN